MFNRKKVKQLEDHIQQLKVQIERLVTHNNEYWNLFSANTDWLARLTAKVEPNPVTIYTPGVLDLLTEWKEKYKTRRVCGPDGCGTFYEIPTDVVDAILRVKNAEVKED